MKDRNLNCSKPARSLAPISHCSGFSLLELLVAMAIFMVIGGAAVSLVNSHVPTFVAQQSQVALNFGLRNAVTQMQLDVGNAGDGFYQAGDTPGWPVGITVVNRAYAKGCWNATTWEYTANCFDILNVITAERGSFASHPSDNAGNQVFTTSTDLYLTPTGTTTLTQLKDFFKSGDQILLVTDDGTQMTTAKLTADAVISGAYVKLVHGKTNADGSNAATNDDHSISTSSDKSGLASTFDKYDWVIKLAPIQYFVDASDKTNPKLIRWQKPTSTQAERKDVIAEQIIGFKIGTSLWNGSADLPYSYSTDKNLTDFTKVRALRISVIGRTPPTPSNRYRNTFDLGPYKIEAVSVVVNPRNLSMKDN